MRLLKLMTVLLLFTPRQVLSQEFPSDPAHVTSRSQQEVLDGRGLGAADNSPPRLLMPLALDLIKDFETWAPLPYDDASSFCTIGYGHLVGKKPCKMSATELMQFLQPLSDKDGDKLLDADTGSARRAIQNLVHQPLADEQFGALTSLVFNIDSENFSNSTLLKAVNNRDFEIAAAQFLLWVKSKGNILRGLVARRACEAALFKGGLAYRIDSKFHREECSSLGAAPLAENLIDIEDGER